MCICQEAHLDYLAGGHLYVSCTQRHIDYGWSHLGCKHHEDRLQLICEAGLICLQLTCGFVACLLQGTNYFTLCTSKYWIIGNPQD